MSSAMAARALQILHRALPRGFLAAAEGGAAAHSSHQFIRQQSTVGSLTAQRGWVAAKYALGVGAAAAAAANSDAVVDTARTGYLIATRLARDISTAAAIVADYKTSVPDSLTGDARAEALAACHQRGADRLLALCFANGGIYVKLGQHVGQLDHLLPEPYVATMRAHVLDRCPASPYAEVARIVEQDLGAPPDVLYASFERSPIASASLAQVHVATRRGDGARLAVKVQHAGLRESAGADIATISFLVAAARAAFPSFDLQWLVDEVRHNLPRELDFVHEAANAERCRANLASSRSRLAGRVHVPEIDHSLTGPRVLTMEFIDGAAVTDRAALAARRVSPAALAALVAEAFAEMIFIHGDVHCDPHAANMLARSDPVTGAPQLVLLDHGLYRRIDDAFRAQYAGLWRALVLADADGIRAHAAALGAGDAYPLFAAMLTQRPWEQIVDAKADHLSALRRGEDEHRALVQSYAAAYAPQIADLLGRMPRALLLLLKTNDCLRAVDNALGAPVNTFVITARECDRALSEAAVAARPGMRARAAAAAAAFRIELQIAALHLASRWAALRVALFGRHRSGSGAPAAAAARDVPQGVIGLPPPEHGAAL